jgi:hypothetical protein
MKILFFATVVAFATTSATAETVYETVSNPNTLSVQAPKVSPRPTARPKNFDAEALLQQTLKKLATQYGCSTITEDCIPPTT